MHDGLRRDGSTVILYALCVFVAVACLVFIHRNPKIYRNPSNRDPVKILQGIENAIRWELTPQPPLFPEPGETPK